MPICYAFKSRTSIDVRLERVVEILVVLDVHHKLAPSGQFVLPFPKHFRRYPFLAVITVLESLDVLELFSVARLGLLPLRY